MELRMLPQEPEKPDILPLFRDQDPQAVIAKAEKDAALYMQNAKPLPFPWYWILGLLLAVAAVILIPHWTKWLVSGTATVLSAVLMCVGLSKRNRRRKICDSLTAQYHPVPPEQWIAAAQRYEKNRRAYTAALDKYNQEREQLDARAEELQSKIAAITGGRSLAECEDFYIQAQRQFQDYATAIREHSRAAELVQALRASHRDVPAPAFPDTLTYSEQDTARLLSDCDYEYRQLQLKLGNTQGRIEALGKEAILRSQLESVTRRIADLENTHAALELAQKTLSDARIQLQRRFAPRITKRAQEIFTQLTGGRYTRLTLADDLAAHVQTTDEATLRSVLWRSEGTVDQLYLSLRLAVAEALTPNAPLVLDDALVRFDGKRLAQALTVLQEESQSKQIILFTCQSREAEVLKGLR